MTSSNETNPKSFPFIGGLICLDFSNTLGGQRNGETREYLFGYEDLVAWSRQTDTITEDQASVLLRAAQQRPGEATATFEKALLFREVIYRIFAAVISGIQPAQADLAMLNAELGKALAGGRVGPVAGGFDWEWTSDPAALDPMFGSIARSAADLLTSLEHALVHECANEACSWLFVDQTKNHRRRWCSTTGCGNVAKVRRHRQRLREK
ncbi:MAG TPA: ABATE domain-containing protein [Ktedonobacteraceae bacterium]